MQFDDLLTHVGEFGPFQKRVYFLVCLTCISHGLRMVALVFLLNTPQHRCAIPGLDNDTYDVTSHEHHLLLNMTIPEEESCFVYTPGNYSYDSNHRPINASQVECDHWVYDTSVFSATVASRFDLVCSNAIKKSHATMAFYGGFLIGSLTLGAISDAIGRKLCLYLSISLVLILGTALAFSSSFLVFTALNFFVGFSTAGIFASAFVIGIELVGMSKRKYTGMFIHLFFSTGVIVMAGLAYWLRDWVTLELAITVPLAIFYIFWWFIPESARWQIQKGQYDKARKTIEEAERVNKTKVPEEAKDLIMPRSSSSSVRRNVPRSKFSKNSCENGVSNGDCSMKFIQNTHDSKLTQNSQGHDETNGVCDSKFVKNSHEIGVPNSDHDSKFIKTSHGNDVMTNGGGDNLEMCVSLVPHQDGGVALEETRIEKASLLDLFKSRVLAIRTLIIFFNWMVAALTFYGLNFNVGNLGTGSIFLNFFFLGLVEYPAHIITIFLVDRVGRRVVHCSMLGTSGVACLLCVLTIVFVPKDYQWATVALAMLGKFGAAGGFGTIYMYSTEIYPTVIRTSALGASCSCARIGAMLSPYIAAMGAETGGPLGRGVPLLVCGLLILAAALMAIALPETMNRKLPETIKDAEMFTKPREETTEADKEHFEL